MTCEPFAGAKQYWDLLFRTTPNYAPNAGADGIGCPAGLHRAMPEPQRRPVSAAVIARR